MENQIIVSIGREYGSGGHVIAELLAKKLEVEVCDRNILDHIAGKFEVDINNLAKYDEKPKLRLFSKTVRGYTNSPEQNVAEMQFALLKSKAVDGDSFVIVGRCADEIFSDMDNFISVFVYADLEYRIQRVMSRHPELDRNATIKKIERHDKKRAAYHNYFCKNKWGEKSTYDLCIDSSKLGIEKTVEVIYQYVINKMKTE